MSENLPPSYRSDTGLWHLTVRVSDHGVHANISLKDNSAEPPRVLVDSNWPGSREGLMEKIENCVYDHPEVLDDYSATIIVESPRTLFVPPAELKEEGDAEHLYGLVYNSHPEDIMIDETGKETILFTLAPGMISFLRRTFPGARLRSHIGILVEKTRNMGAGIRIFARIRKQYLDLIAFNGDNLLSASVQPWGEWTDIIYRILNLADIYSLPAKETEINLIADEKDEAAREAKEFLSKESKPVRIITDTGDYA